MALVKPVEIADRRDAPLELRRDRLILAADREGACRPLVA
jgi:hypothetical protein